MIHNFTIFWFIPLGVNAFSVLSHTPGFLYKIPDGVGEIVIDVTDNIDDADEKPEQWVHDPTVGHVSSRNGAHSELGDNIYTA